MLTNNDLTLKETLSVKRGTCPDCGGTEILSGPEAPGCQNKMCSSCKMRFNIPVVNGIPGERIGKQDDQS